MDGLSVKVTMLDGSSETYTLTPRIIVEFEQKFNKGLGKLLAEEQRLEHVYYLGWAGMKASGKVVKPWGLDALDVFKSVELVTDPFSESTETA